MAVVQSRASRWWNRTAIALALAMLVASMIPLYWIGSTAFKARSVATTVPPTVFFTPEITPFVKLFTARVQQRGERDEAAYAKAPWWEKLVMDGGDRFIKDDKGNINVTQRLGVLTSYYYRVDAIPPPNRAVGYYWSSAYLTPRDCGSPLPGKALITRC